MPDRERVLQALAHHGRGECITEDVVCPYWGVMNRNDVDACFRQLCMDAVELLKADKEDIDVLSEKYSDLLDRMIKEQELVNPCTVCQEFDCDGCEFKHRKAVSWDADD